MNRRIFAAAVLIAILTVMARLGTAVQDIVAAAKFGTSDAMEAFLLAYLFPSFAVQTVAASVSGSLIPAFVDASANAKPEEASGLVRDVMGRILILLLVTIAILAICFPLILPHLATTFSPSKKEKTRELFYILLPLVAFSGPNTIWTAILNAKEKFAVASIAPLVTPACATVALLTLVKPLGVNALAYGVVGGTVLESIIVGTRLSSTGVSLLPRFGHASKRVRDVFREYPSLVAAGLLMSSTMFVDQSMAAMLGGGSIAALAYGRKVVSFILSISAVALGRALFSYVSAAVATRDFGGLRHTLRTYATLILAVAIPTTALLICFSPFIIAILFQRGAFTTKDTALVNRVQMAFALQIPFYLLSTVAVRTLSALRRNNLLMIISGVSVALNLTLNYILMKWLGVTGIALSTSCVYAVSMVLAFWNVRRQLRRIEAATASASS